MLTERVPGTLTWSDFKERKTMHHRGNHTAWKAQFCEGKLKMTIPQARYI